MDGHPVRQHPGAVKQGQAAASVGQQAVAMPAAVASPPMSRLEQRCTTASTPPPTTSLRRQSPARRTSHPLGGFYFLLRSFIAAVAFGALLLAAPSLLEGRMLRGLLPSAGAGADQQVQYAFSVAGDLSGPLAVAVGSLGDIYVADATNGQVKVFGPEGQPRGAVGRKAGDAPELGELVYPVGVALDAQGNLYVSDVTTGHISVFDGQGRFQAYLAETEDGQRVIRTPGALFYHQLQGLLYVSDLAEHRIVALAPDGSVRRTFGSGKGVGPGQLSYPGSVWVDGAGTVYVADANNYRIQVYRPDGTPAKALFSDILNLPRGLAGDSSGRLYVTNALGHSIAVLAPDGQVHFSFGTSGSEPREFGFPNGLAVAQGRLYVADRANDRVQVFLLPSAR
ncbi:MAG: hypothetical protein HYY02_08530 [Chloroflexi bacterium]|nr:hypothetical protein [Chloroflexota bacterium]